MNVHANIHIHERMCTNMPCHVHAPLHTENIVDSPMHLAFMCWNITCTNTDMYMYIHPSQYTDTCARTQSHTNTCRVSTR